MARINRIKSNLLPLDKRVTTFEEVTQVLTDEQAQLEASRCLNCSSKPCVSACPVGINIPKFILQITQNNLSKADDTIKKDSSLGSICGRVCPQENQCEGKCIRTKMEGAVAIGALERYVSDWGAINNNNLKKIEFAKGVKVAVIGSGPSGLSCASELISNGVKVDVFEAFHAYGGVLTYGIPEFRLPKVVVNSQIDNLKKMGVKFVSNVVAGKSIMLDELRKKYDAVFIGTGAGLPLFLNIKGEMLNGVMSANELLTRVNLMKGYSQSSWTPVSIGSKVVVIGAGNVAMDSARTCKRLGADVTIVYRRSMAEVPARAEEVEHAIEEGIQFVVLTNPIEILGESAVSGILCSRMELSDFDASGRRRPVEIPNSNFEVECDCVIIALGTSPSPILTQSSDKLVTNPNGTICVDNCNRTNLNDVYAGGDAVTGAATVISAMGAGKRAATAILKQLISKQ